MARSYEQYCPIACALDLVGERWSLLIVRELLEEGELRYSDLHARLAGCGTNILAARLKQLEAGGVVRRRKLTPPAASTVYELTEYGQALRLVMYQLAHWGARMMGPPRAEGLEDGWLGGALRMVFPPTSNAVSVEFRIGDEIVSLANGDVRDGPVDEPDAVVSGDAPGFYHLVVDRDLGAVSVRGDVGALTALLETLPPTVSPAPVAS
ncbi:MAG: winged helix-turn-helix transcriptional regulator [Gaiellaceae bacterium]